MSYLNVYFLIEKATKKGGLLFIVGHRSRVKEKTFHSQDNPSQFMG